MPDELTDVERLQERADDLAERVAELEDQFAHLEIASTSAKLDQYDARVIQECAAHDSAVFHLSQFREFYQRAGLRSDDAIKQRIKALTSMHFESAGLQYWRLVEPDQ